MLGVTPTLGSRQNLNLVPRQEMGPTVYSTKAFLFIQKLTIGFILQIFF